MSTYFDDQPDDPRDESADGQASPLHQEAQSPLLLHDMQTPEQMFAAPRASQRSRQAVVAALLVAGAVGAIFAMRQFGMGPAVSLADIDMDYKPAPSATGLSPKRVLADLERSRHAVQVPAENITQDPFELDSAKPAAAEPVIDHDLARRAELERLRLAREAQQKVLADAFAKLHLQGVMGGSTPMARIDGRVYKIGMTVAERFTLSAIEGREVTLTADDRAFVLTMDKNR